MEDLSRSAEVDVHRAFGKTDKTLIPLDTGADDMKNESMGITSAGAELSAYSKLKNDRVLDLCLQSKETST